MEIEILTLLCFDSAPVFHVGMLMESFCGEIIMLNEKCKIGIAVYIGEYHQKGLTRFFQIKVILLEKTKSVLDEKFPEKHCQIVSNSTINCRMKFEYNVLTRVLSRLYLKLSFSILAKLFLKKIA